MNREADMAYRTLGCLVCLVACLGLRGTLGDRADAGECDVNINNPRSSTFKKNLAKVAVDEEDPEYWRRQARGTIREAMQMTENLNTARAENIVLFIADGMSIPTVTGTRILKGQKNDMPGEEGFLSFEEFPYVGMSKTYNVDSQVPDCGSAATAILTGVKTKNKMIGLSGKATPGDCASSSGNELTSILKTAKADGWSVGIVTTAALVNSTPAAAYANTPDETWKYKVPDTRCDDIAKQFVYNFPIDVALGGGRFFFMKTDQSDPVDPTSVVKGGRTDEDLIASWKTEREKNGKSAKYVTTKAELLNLDDNTDFVLGMFHMFDMEYNDRKSNAEPSLTEMVEKAMKILQKKNKRYFLLVEGANIDRGHHENKVGQALHETLEMDRAVEKVVQMTDSKDTMIVVTADHGHTMTMAGYPCRGQPILGKVYAKEEFADINDDRPYTQLGYANGPSALQVQKGLAFEGGRPRIDEVDTENLDYQAQSLVPFALETHGGEDVQIFVDGPMAHLVQGVHEQSYIHTLMEYSACIGRHTAGDHCTK